MGICLKEVSYSYNPVKKNTKYQLENISLEISDKDEFVAIIGATGSGKSTLSTIFNALKIPTLGEAYVCGIKLKEKRGRKENYNDIRKHVGLVFQFSDYQLFEETVIKDVAFGPSNFGYSNEESLEIAKKALELVGVKEELYLKSPLELSGGEKRLASISGIIALDPDILVFDEPTSGLDPETRNKLMKLFDKLNIEKHKSIVYITHDMNFVYSRSKRVLLMKDYHLAFDGTPYDLFNNNKELVKEAGVDMPDVIREIEFLESIKVSVNKKAKTIEELARSIK